MESLIGFVGQWLNGNQSTFNQVSLLSLIIIAGGSILLIEAVTKILNRGSEEKQYVSHRLNLKAIVVYIIVLVMIMMLGYTFRNILPIFTIQPWLSLLISIVGLLGLLVLFKRK
ncbi:hypothetical protein LPB68_16265 [Paenibacillus crassostreae]|nr:hypothetical protein LPB68_16265 [Paenibacillus crassostreae]